MMRAHARLVLVLVVVVAAVEWIAGFFAYRSAIAIGDWDAARAATAAIPSAEPVFTGTRWLGPLARMHVPRVAEPRSVAPADLRGLPVFHVLAFSGDEDLFEHLRPETTPTRTSTLHFGALELATYHQPHASTVVFDALDASWTVRLNGHACRRSGEGWQCRGGAITTRFVEVDYFPRRCIVFDVPSGSTVRLDTRAELGTHLRGHVGFDDFNRRLRSDAPLSLRLEVDDETLAHWAVTDTQGHWPFAVASVRGVHDLSIELVTSARGTYVASDYDRSTPQQPCLELRSFMEPQR